MHNRDFFLSSAWKWGRFQDAKSLLLLHNQESTFSAHLQRQGTEKNFRYSRLACAKTFALESWYSSTFYQSEVSDPSFSPLLFFCHTKIPHFEIDGFVLQLQRRTSPYPHFPTDFFLCVYQVGVTLLLYRPIFQEKRCLDFWRTHASIKSSISRHDLQRTARLTEARWGSSR